LIVFIASEQVLDSYFYKRFAILGDYLHREGSKAKVFGSEDFERSENILLKFFTQFFPKKLAVLV